jgi:hypothetical protein
MNYTVYSFVALSRMSPQAGQPNPKPQQQRTEPVPAPGSLRLIGTARISGTAVTAPWYRRLFRRLRIGPEMLGPEDRVEFELVLNPDPKQVAEGSLSPDLRSQLGLAPNMKRAVIEVFVLEGPREDDAQKAVGS